MSELKVGDLVEFKNIVTGEKMQGRVVKINFDGYVMVKGKNATFVARTSETTLIPEEKP